MNLRRFFSPVLLNLFLVLTLILPSMIPLQPSFAASGPKDLEQQDWPSATSGSTQDSWSGQTANTAVHQVYLPLVTTSTLSRPGLPPAVMGTEPPLSDGSRAQLRSLGLRPWDRYSGDLVSVVTGNHVQRFRDIRVPGIAGFDFDLVRTYNSLDERDSFFGIGWSSLLDMQLRLADDGSVDVRYADGSGVFFLREAAGFFPGQGGVFDQLVGSGSDFTLTTHDQTRYQFTAVDSLARLVALQDRHGNQIQIVRDGTGRPQQVTDSAGRTYTFAYSGDHISQLTDPLGRAILYEYDDAGNLTTVTDANGGTTQFSYETGRLATLTDPAGIRYLENIYDSSGRVIEQKDADDRQSTFSYDSIGETVFTDKLGHQTRYRYDTLGRVLAIVDPLNNRETFGYDDDYNVISATNKLGNSWTYTFDERGNQLTAINPFGFVTRNGYNETNDVTRFTDSGGFDGSSRTTHYLYDSQGNLTSITRPDGSDVSATYDSQGQLLTLTDPNGNSSNYNYDSSGNLIQQVDALDQVTQYTYDAVGRRLNQIDANGSNTSFVFDNNNNLVETVDAQGNSTRFSYDLNDMLLERNDTLGRITRYEYDAYGQLVAETDPAGHTTRYSYDAMHNQISRTDANGHITQYSYDALSRPVQRETLLGEVTQWEYDENGNLEKLVDPLGHETRFVYDVLNRPETIIDALGGETGFRYDEVGRLTRMINPQGNINSYLYDLLDRRTILNDALGGQWRTNYDVAGNPIAEIDALGRATTYMYDALNRLATVTDPQGHTTQYAYDSLGNLAQLVNAAGGITSYSYDESGNQVSMTDALGGITQYRYDSAGQLIAETDANGYTTQYAYDLDGLLTSLTDASGQTTQFSYDANHNRIQLTNPLGHSWLTSYDALGRRISQTDPLGNLDQQSYDALGHISRRTDANGIVTRYAYDALGRLTSVTQNERTGEPADAQTNVITSYTYDVLGNVLSTNDAQGGTSNFSYDRLGRLVQETNPLGHRWSFAYDAVGNVIQRTDARGQVTQYSYDADGLLLQIEYADGSSVVFTYDELHNQTRMVDGLGTTSRTYDTLQRLLSSSNHQGETVRYTYDAVGNLTGLQYPDGRSILYEYDPTRFVTTITEPGGGQFQVSRDAAHQIASVLYPNQANATYVWDAAQRLTMVSHSGADGQLLNRFDYAMDPAGNRLQVVEHHNWRQPSQLTSDYQYDSLYRLIQSVDNEGRFTSYVYDAVGNRLQMATNHDAALGVYDTLITTRYDYNSANQLLAMTAEGIVAETALNKWRKQMRNALRPFINHVRAQTGRHIETSTALTLRQQAEALVKRLERKPAPSKAEVTAALAALAEIVTVAGQNGQIDNHGIVNSLLVKLRCAQTANDQLEQLVVSTTFTYDENGNRLSRLMPNISSSTQDWLRTDYHYDIQNRLQLVQELHDADGRGTWQMVSEAALSYDGYGRLFRQQFNDLVGGDSSQRDYIYDGLDPVAEYLGPGSTHVNRYRGLERLLSMDDGLGLGQSSRYYYHDDGLGSVSSLTDSSSQHTHNYRYQDFGLILGTNDQAAGNSSFNDPPNHHGYTGQAWDNDLSLLHFYARAYDPRTGTWLQPDPYRGQLMQPMTLHRYAYVGNNPITYTDLYGFDRKSTQPEPGIFTNRARQPTLPLVGQPVQPSPPQSWLSALSARVQRAETDRVPQLFADLFDIPIDGSNLREQEQTLAEIIYGRQLVTGSPILSQLDRLVR